MEILMQKTNTIKTIATPCMNTFFFFFNDTATTEIYTLSLHDALPISPMEPMHIQGLGYVGVRAKSLEDWTSFGTRSEEHTSELQSQSNLVCRLLLEKKKKNKYKKKD